MTAFSHSLAVCKCTGVPHLPGSPQLHSVNPYPGQDTGRTTSASSVPPGHLLGTECLPVPLPPVEHPIARPLSPVGAFSPVCLYFCPHLAFQKSSVFCLTVATSSPPDVWGTQKLLTEMQEGAPLGGVNMHFDIGHASIWTQLYRSTLVIQSKACVP